MSHRQRNRRADISVTATGGDIRSLAGLSLQSGLDATLQATGAATVRGDVTAGGAYGVTGSSVTLGNVGDTVTQSAVGNLTVTATGGNVILHLVA